MRIACRVAEGIMGQAVVHGTLGYQNVTCIHVVECNIESQLIQGFMREKSRDSKGNNACMSYIG